MRSQKKRVSGGLIFLLVVVLLAAGVFLGYKSFLKKNLAPMDANNPISVSVEIPRGSGTQKVSSQLYHAGLIRNSLAFRIRSKQLKYDGQYKAGEYTLSTDLSVDEMMAILVEGPDRGEELQFTVVEGLTVQETLESLANQGVDSLENLQKEAESGKFDYWFLEDAPEGPDRLEGFLMPETYRIYAADGAHGAINRMLSQFSSILNNELQDMIRRSGYTVREVVTIASLIEREAATEKDRPLIASVIYNRLQQKMKLQIDATIIYCLAKAGIHKTGLLNSDYTETTGAYASPYNTYQNAGLPPGPICSPRKSSLVAAVRPETTSYLFYVLGTDGSGNHVFAETYAEHEKNVAAYQAWKNKKK